MEKETKDKKKKKQKRENFSLPFTQSTLRNGDWDKPGAICREMDKLHQEYKFVDERNETNDG